MDPAELTERLRAGDTRALARAITLVESTKREHRARAQALLQELLPDTGKAHRIGITGVPGVGKSTAIDQLGMNLIDAGHRVAVLADRKVIAVGTIPELLALDHPWIQEYFSGPRGRAALSAKTAHQRQPKGD